VADAVCARCGLSVDGAVDCPSGYPAGCALKAAMALPGSAVPDRALHAQPVTARLSGALAEGGVLVGLELAGLLASPFSMGAAGMFTSAVAMIYTALRDLRGGRYRLRSRSHGALVVDVVTGQPASETQALRRNLPLVVAWSLAVLPDPFGLLGWMAVGFLVAVDAMLVLVRRDGRRLGDLLAGTQVVSGPD